MKVLRSLGLGLDRTAFGAMDLIFLVNTGMYANRL